MVAPQAALGGRRALDDPELRVGDLEPVIVEGPDLEEVEVVVEGVERQLPAVDLRAGPRGQDGLQPLAPELEPVAQGGREGIIGST